MSFWQLANFHPFLRVSFVIVSHQDQHLFIDHILGYIKILVMLKHASIYNRWPWQTFANYTCYFFLFFFFSFLFFLLLKLKFLFLVDNLITTSFHILVLLLLNENLAFHLSQLFIRNSINLNLRSWQIFQERFNIYTAKLGRCESTSDRRSFPSFLIYDSVVVIQAHLITDRCCRYLESSCFLSFRRTKLTLNHPTLVRLSSTF